MLKLANGRKVLVIRLWGVNQELSLINNFDVEDKELLKAYYLDTLNLALAKEKYDRNMASRARFVESKVETPQVELNIIKEKLKNQSYLKWRTII